MADKFASLVNAFVYFVAGEQPTADKFNALVSQTKYGFSGLESAIGDIHSSSWPYIADDIGTSSTRLTIPFYRSITTGDELGGTDAAGRSLDIVNLARLIGPSSNLNPLMMVEVGDNNIVDEAIAGSDRTEFQLRYPVAGLVSATNPTFTDDTAGALANFKSNVQNVNSTGDYHVDSNGKVTCFTPTASGILASYTVDPKDWGGGSSYSYSRMNVIPDPNQVAAESSEQVVVSVAGADGLHTVQLPLITHMQTNISADAIELSGAKDLNYQLQAKLPFVLTENMTTGQSIPSGFVYLKNVTTNEVYTDATYIYNDEDTFQVGGVDLDDAISAANVFQVLTVGTDITSAILDLQFKMHRHRHNRAFGERGIRVQDLVNNHRSPGLSGTFVPSTMDSNHFSQYLHRDGYRPDDEGSAANDANALRGNLVFGLNSESPGEYVLGANGITSSGSDTWGICFGGNPGASTPDTTWGPVIYGEYSGSVNDGPNLVLKTWDDNDAEVKIEGQGNFVTDVRNHNMSALLQTTIESGTDITITSGDDVFINATGGSGSLNLTSEQDDVNINAGVDFNVTAEEDVRFTLSTSTTNNIFLIDYQNWNGGSTSEERGILFTDSTPDGILRDNDSFFQVRAPNQNGPLVTFNNTSTSVGVAKENCVLELKFGKMNSSESAGNTIVDNESGAKYIFFKNSNRKVGRIEARIKNPSTATWRNDAFFCESGSGGFSGGTGRSIQRTGDVAYVSGQNDFGEVVLAGDLAEWTPEIESVEKDNTLGLPEGMVVFVREGKFWRSGTGTPMVVTHRAVLIGNATEENEDCPHEILSFIGQVPTVVKGPFKSGDYLLAQEGNYCIAVDPEEISFSDYKKAIGTAWESAESEVTESTYTKVLCAIGVK